jgi:hypothetical protein
MLTLSLLFLVGLATAVGTHDVQSQLERWHYDRHLATERTVFDRRGLARHQRAATFVLSPIPGWDSDDVSTAGPPTRSFRATFQSSNTYRARGNCGIPAPRQMAEPIRPLTCAIGAHQAFAPVLDVASETPPGPRPRKLRQLRQRPVAVVGARPSLRPRTAERRRDHPRGRHHQALRAVFSGPQHSHNPSGFAQASRPVRPAVRGRGRRRRTAVGD